MKFLHLLLVLLNQTWKMHEQDCSVTVLQIKKPRLGPLESPGRSYTVRELRAWGPNWALHLDPSTFILQCLHTLQEPSKPKVAIHRCSWNRWLKRDSTQPKSILLLFSPPTQKQTAEGSRSKNSWVTATHCRTKPRTSSGWDFVQHLTHNKPIINLY